MLRSAAPRLMAAAVICSLAPVTAAAQVEREAPLRYALESLPLAAAADGSASAPAESASAPAVRPHEGRPPTLVPLYVTFGTLQVLDVHSTSRAIGQGAAEANPLMKGIAGNEAGLLALKAAGTAGVILASEKMWKRNRKAAVVFMIAANSAMAWVVQHNYRAVR